MNIIGIISICFAVVYGVTMLIFLVRTKKPFKNLIINAIIGIGAIALVCITHGLTGVSIPVNQWTVLSGAVGGIPAVCGLLVLRIIFNI